MNVESYIATLNQLKKGVKFHNREELVKYHEEVKSSTREHMKQDKKDKKELFTLRYFLETPEGEILGFPMLLKKTESPDFIIDPEGRAVGVEVAEVTNEDSQKSFKNRKENKYTGVGSDYEKAVAKQTQEIIRKKSGKIGFYKKSEIKKCILLLYLNMIGLVVDEKSLVKELSDKPSKKLIEGSGFDEIYLIKRESQAKSCCIKLL